MPRAPKPLFLANTRYRQKRLRDALTLIPVLGALLFALPILWPRGQGAGDAATSNSSALVYLFVVWFGLIVLGGVLAWRLRPDESETLDAGPEAPGQGGGPLAGQRGGQGRD